MYGGANSKTQIPNHSARSAYSASIYGTNGNGPNGHNNLNWTGRSRNTVGDSARSHLDSARSEVLDALAECDDEIANGGV